VVAAGFLVGGALLGSGIGSADAVAADDPSDSQLAAAARFAPRVAVVPLGASLAPEILGPHVQPAPEPEPEVIEPDATDTDATEPEPTATTSSLVAPPGGSFASAVFAETNLVRAAHGLPPLAWTDCGAASAAAWSANLVGRGLFHQDMAAVMAACPPAWSAGENLATSPASAADMVTMWVNSPGHLANILNPQFTHLGVGCVPDSISGFGATTCTQVFLALG